MDKNAYQKRAENRQKDKDAVSVAPADIEELSSTEITRRKSELERLNKEQLDDFKDRVDVPSSPQDGADAG